MKKLLVVLVVLSGFAANGQQYNMGFGLRAGVTNFLGDIGGGDVARNFVYNMELKDTRWTTGVFWRYRFHPLMAVQTSFTYGRIQGADSESENYARRGRNLSFRNDIFEGSAKFEFYPQILAVNDVGYKGKYRLDYQTYFTVGVGGVLHNPKAELNGDYVKLRPLMTEGKRYSPIAFTMPMGGGFFFTYKRQHRFGFEYTWSWTFTDYLDDISDVYVDPSQMASDPNAAILANRWNGIGTVPAGENYLPGNQRGDVTDRDNFMFMTISYSY
ncbi:MAG: DUF6089 family protein, partial [Crocinitomicaceae bacterium]|nr:DUF6089 family protein [Crocinitomicaceae bacterium]